jgi:SAM-dependent methyltransferase
MLDIDIYTKKFEEMGYSGPHLEALKLIGCNKRVLDVGCSTGYLIKAIHEILGGTVDGVEVNPEAAKLAAQFAGKIYVGSIEEGEVVRQLHDTYDVLLFMDVLEHLKDPLSVLKNLRPLLSEEGYLIASVPNIANWRIRLSLFMGKFEYQESGLLDKGHLRFFTLKTLKKLFDEAGYRIVYLDFSFGDRPSILKNISRRPKNYLKAIFKKLACFFPGLFANQFIVKAVKR